LQSVERIPRLVLPVPAVASTQFRYTQDDLDEHVSAAVAQTTLQLGDRHRRIVGGALAFAGLTGRQQESVVRGGNNLEREDRRRHSDEYHDGRPVSIFPNIRVLKDIREEFSQLTYPGTFVACMIESRHPDIVNPNANLLGDRATIGRRETICGQSFERNCLVSVKRIDACQVRDAEQLIRGILDASDRESPFGVVQYLIEVQYRGPVEFGQHQWHEDNVFYGTASESEAIVYVGCPSAAAANRAGISLKAEKRRREASWGIDVHSKREVTVGACRDLVKVCAGVMHSGNKLCPAQVVQGMLRSCGDDRLRQVTVNELQKAREDLDHGSEPPSAFAALFP